MMTSLARYITTIRDDCLPFWAEDGYDNLRDQFHERLSFDGTACAVPSRAMVQARQIYVFAHAALLGWFDRGAERATAAMTMLRRRFVVEHSGMASVAFAINPLTGEVTSDTRESYTHAFVLLAAAYLYRLTGDPGLLTFARQVTAFIEQEMVDRKHGGVVDQLPFSADAWKRQNPQMHLLEAYVALEQVAPGHGYGKRAATLAGLFRRRLFDRKRAMLIEYFAGDWSRCPDIRRANLIEPGHHYEWVWLLAEIDKLGRQSFADERTELFDFARKHGHAANDLIYDEIGEDGRPVTASHRLWPHTEAIKSAVVRHDEGRPDALTFAERMAGALYDLHLNRPFMGGWVDHLNADLSPRVDYVPASSLYHLFLAAAEADSGFVGRTSPP